MGKVRVYELAKEAGMKSKELADKLIELGYPVKGLSSTVDEEMAAEIRRKLLGQGMIKVTDDHIVMKKRKTTASKRKTTVVRRRTKVQKKEVAQKEKEEAAREEAARKEKLAAPEEIPAQDSLPDEQKKGETVAADSVEQAIADQVEDSGLSGEASVAESSLPEVEDNDIKQAAIESAVEEEPVSLKKEEKLQKKVTPSKKGNAKIVGRVELPSTPESKKKERRPARAKKTASEVKQGVGVDAAPMSADDRAVKGKKKGKKTVVAQDERDVRPKRTTKNRRAKRKIDFSQEGEFTRYRRGRKKKGKGAKDKSKNVSTVEMKASKKKIKVIETISVGDLAKKMGVKGSEVIAKLMGLGVMATLNQALDVETALLVAADFGYEVEQAMTEELEIEALQVVEDEKGGEAKPRPPVVTVMGHVDHGKTSILDAIRKTDVAAGEAGGITQHIGAYHVKAASGDVTFVDTPGHAAFTEMRSRGAKVTDLVILVVAADDGVMEQTKEAIAHSQAADVPIVVAINKIDKDNANPERVKGELGDFGLIPEEWGGDTIFCETSAKKGIGIDELLENVQLLADILELKADPEKRARGTVIEAQLHKGRGPVATVLVQEGTLRRGDFFVAGMFSGKVRMLINERGESVKEAGPSIPVEIQGISGVPQAGDEFVVVPDEKMAKSVANSRQMKARESELAAASKVSLDNLFEKMAEQEVIELKVILRSDVQGTLQAFAQAAEKLSTDAIRVKVLHEGTGAITENDVHLAAASEAIIIGFNVRPSVKVKELAEQEGVDIRSYEVIYHALEDIEKAMVGMLAPDIEERVIGTAEVRDTFSVPKVGVIAGCFVVDGKIERNAGVRVLREGVVMYTGKIGSLRRFKDDVKEVMSGYECGIGVENYNDIKVGDTLEAFVEEEVAATL